MNENKALPVHQNSPSEARPGDSTMVGARRALLREIDREFSDTSAWTGQHGLDEQVRAAMEQIPREAFLPSALRSSAYANRPLPIGNGQTISQPFIVALMTQLLALRPQHRVLEVGTGSGYQAAILACLVDEVYSIERIPALSAHASTCLRKLGIRNVTTCVGDAWEGWYERAPFDAIMVTAAAAEIPPPLIQQLAPGGRLLLPLGDSYSQELVLLHKLPDGSLLRENKLPVVFVPFVRS